MKFFGRLVSAVAVMAALSVGLMGCGGDSGTNPGGGGGGGGGGSGFTITGIPAKYNGMYAYTMMSMGETNTTGTGLIYGGQSLIDPESGEILYTFSRISNGKVSLSLWTINGFIIDRDQGTSSIDTKKYSGSDIISGVPVVFVDVGNAYDLDNSLVRGGVVFQQVKFSKGSATKSWSDGVAVEYR